MGADVAPGDGPLPPRGQQVIRGGLAPLQSNLHAQRLINRHSATSHVFHGKFPRDTSFESCISPAAPVSTLDFESAKPSVVKSIRQRDLLNNWLRLCARQQRLPRIEDYRPERLTEELPDLVHYAVDIASDPARLTILSNGTRVSFAYGRTGGGRLLDDYLGPSLAAVVMPIYRHCLARALPVYTIAHVKDIHGHEVAYERLLLPFSDNEVVTHVIASVKMICQGRRLRNQEPDARYRQLAATGASLRDRSRPLSSDRPGQLRRGHRVQLSGFTNQPASFSTGPLALHRSPA